MILQADAPWKWDRWSAFWYWVEQPDRWGPGNIHFPDGDETFTHPDDPTNVTTFNLHAPVVENAGQLNTLIVLDGIVRRYDCIATDSDCAGSNERIQGLFLDSTNSGNHWANYVYQTVNYFKQFGISYYQAYNEPNVGYFNGGTDPEGEGWANDYSRLAQVSIEAAHRADPNAKLILAASINEPNEYTTGSWFDKALGYIVNDQVYNGAAAFAIHSYQRPYWTEYYYQFIQDNHPQVSTLPAWVTESGVSLCAHHTPGHLCVENEKEQSSYVIQQYAYALKVGAQRVFHHRFADDLEADFGLYENDDANAGNYSPRDLTLKATKIVADYLQGGQFDAGSSILPSQNLGYAKFVFKQPDQTVSVYWATKNEPKDIDIALSAKATYWVDQAGMGDRIKGSTYSLHLPGATTNTAFGEEAMVGSYTYLIVETNKAADISNPLAYAGLICTNEESTRPDAALIMGYDGESGIDRLVVNTGRGTASASAAHSVLAAFAVPPGEYTFDLSGLAPNVLYITTTTIIPDVGQTWVYTVTDKAGNATVGSITNKATFYCPGGDNPDDNFSAASAVSLPAGGNAVSLDQHPPRVAVLNNGFTISLLRLLLSQNEPALFVETDFDPAATNAQYPVLIIPTGGLYGLSDSAVFRARLEEYTNLGGTLIVFDQQHGSDYAALPGGSVGGYGWDEDISCFVDAFYLAQYHPALAGFDHPRLSIHADGFFRTYPVNSTMDPFRLSTT